MRNAGSGARRSAGCRAGRAGASILPLQHDQPAVLEHPHLAPVLALVRRRRLLGRDRCRLVDGPAAVLDHQVRQREIVAEARVDLDVLRAAHRVDRAVPACHRAELRLGRRGRPSRSASTAPPGSSRRRPRAGAGRTRTRPPGRRTARRACAERPGAQVAFASEKATMLGRPSRAPRGPGRRPCRRAGCGSRGRPPTSASSSVRSVEASEVTTISSLSRG